MNTTAKCNRYMLLPGFQFHDCWAEYILPWFASLFKGLPSTFFSSTRTSYCFQCPFPFLHVVKTTLHVAKTTPPSRFHTLLHSMVRTHKKSWVSGIFWTSTRTPNWLPTDWAMEARTHLLQTTRSDPTHSSLSLLALRMRTKGLGQIAAHQHIDFKQCGMGSNMFVLFWGGRRWCLLIYSS